MKKLAVYLVSAFATVLFATTHVQPVAATSLTNGDYTFQSLDPAPTGTGFGTYSVILFENSAGGSGNSGDGVNVDNSNRLLPTGGGAGADASASLFWMTSIGDLRAYYDLSFGANKVTNIVLFLDVNEEGSGSNPLNLDTLTIYKNSTTTPTSLNPTGLSDLTSDQQGSITGQSAGTLLTKLSTSPQSLDQFATGGGKDDWAIFTGINPYDPSFNVNDTLLFNFKISALDNGPETLSIRPDISNCDFSGQVCGSTSTEVPEPSTLFLLASGLVALGGAQRRQKSAILVQG